MALTQQKVDIYGGNKGIFMTSGAPFWKTKTMAEMSSAEWESLCDGCGKCCLIRMEDEDDGRIYNTDVACQLLDGTTCRCKDYGDRHATVPDCVVLKPDTVKKLSWIPQTCAYRLVANGEDLPDWHHLISSSRDTIHEAGMSVQSMTVSELEVDEEDHVNRITIWPGEPDVMED